MSKNLTSALFVAVALTLWLGSGVIMNESQAKQTQTIELSSSATSSQGQAALNSVRVSVATAEPRARNIVLRGRTEAKRSVDVTAEITGKVVSRPVERGDQVTQGQVLCEIAVDDRDVAVAEARANFEQARIEHAGSLKLKGQDLLSEVAIATSAAREEAAKAQLLRQELNLERTRITAPYDGVIEHLHMQVGDYAMPGASCATLIDLDPMLVIAHVSEEEVENLRTGSLVTGSTRFGTAITGELSFVGNESDPVTRTYPVEITVANSDYRIRSGLTASLQADVGQVLAHKVSPSLLTLGDKGSIGVRSLDDDNRVVFNVVEIVEDGNDGLWVAGLPDTVSLITVGQEYVSVGDIVVPLYDSTEEGQFAAR